MALNLLDSITIFWHILFFDVIYSSWANSNSVGWEVFVLKEKLKSLKGMLKFLNKEVFGNLIHCIDTLRKEINILDSKVKQGVIQQLELVERTWAIYDLCLL